MRYDTIEDFIDEEVSLYYDYDFDSELVRLESEEMTKVDEFDDDFVEENRSYACLDEIHIDGRESVYVEFDCNGYASDETFDGGYRYQVYARLVKNTKPISSWYGINLEIGYEDWRYYDYELDKHIDYTAKDYIMAEYVLYKYLENKYMDGQITQAA